MGTSVGHGDPFVVAVNFVVDVLEGGSRYTDDPNDAGGATRYGLSRRANPDIDVRNLTRDQAITIYHERYWRPCRADVLPSGVALQHFAAYVNMRPGTAVKCLQSAVTGVKVDGLLGPKTIGAVQQFRPQRELRARHSRACVEFYYDLAERVPYNRRFLHGWIGRVCRVADMAGRMGDE